MKKTPLWRGLSVLFSFTCTLALMAGSIAEGYRATIDTALGTQSEVFRSESSESDPLYERFKPSQELLNPDGSGNSKALIEKAIDLGRREAAEGSVLLKNNTENGGGLPLSENQRVTLFGIRSRVSLIGSTFGVKAVGPYISLEQALGGSRTDFANTIAWHLKTNYQTGEQTREKTMSSWSGDEFDFEGAGLLINPVMSEAYRKLNDTYLHSENETADKNYDPQEPAITELEAVAPDYKESLREYSDAAIVVLSRPSAESKDYLPGSVAEGTGAEEPLALTTNERDMISLAKESSDNVIVLINSANAMEIAELKADPDISSILWIGFPGSYGMLGVADIISGRTSPSGGLADIYAAYNMSAPAMQNMGDFTYANADELITRDKSNKYIMEAEGIYVGYRYYETRYFDSVLGQGNAKSSVGAYASNTGWSYDDEVVYGFGYGLSYTEFEKELIGEPEYEIETEPDTGVTNAYGLFKVRVRNVGKRPGKTSVQLYGQAPYTKGGIEKPAVQLLNYEKTGELAPGESTEITVKADLQFIASYDSGFDNGDGTKGSYILEPGSYYFAVGNGAHDALNNMMALSGIEPELLSGEADAGQAVRKEIDEDFLSMTAFSLSKTGERVKNQLDYADWNYFQEGEVEYLSRADWAATFPKTYDALTLTKQELIDKLNGRYYTISTDDDTSAILWEQNNDVMFHELAGLDYDDPKWQALLDKMSLEEAQYLATYGGPSIPGARSIGTQEAYLAENCGNGVVVSLNASKDTGAPWTIPAEDKNSAWNPQVLGNAGLIASTFNPELQREVGEFVGEESLFVGIPILWGPGLNTHRHAYNGRNAEYYSEDPVLSGNTAMEFAIGALEYGLIAAPKHYAFNDQETNRAGVAPYMTEQRAREIELRAYQIAFEATKYDTEAVDAGMRGLMVSFSKIGPVECTASRELMTNILKKEWGFIGYAVTDIYDDMDIYGAVLTSGTTCYDTRGMSGFYGNTTLENTSKFAAQIDGSTVNGSIASGDAFMQESIKESAHNVLYAMSQSNLMNRYNSTTRIEQQMTWWRMLYIAIAGVSAVLTLGSFAFFVLSTRRKESEAENE